MPTRIVIPIAPPDAEGRLSWAIDVQQNYRETIDKLFPPHGHATELERRMALTFTKVDDGKAVFILPQLVHLIEELDDE